MSRYTADVLKLTGAVGLPDPSSGSYLDTKGFWGTDVNAYLLLVDAEFALTYAGNPNGNVASTYIGRKIWDTTNSRYWYATNVANAASTVWVQASVDPKSRTVTAAGNITVLATDDIIDVALSSPAAIDINLPTGLGSTTKKVIRIIDGARNSSSYNLTVKTADLINGAASFVISDDGASYAFFWNGTTWRIM